MLFDELALYIRICIEPLSDLFRTTDRTMESNGERDRTDIKRAGKKSEGNTNHAIGTSLVINELSV